MNQLTDDYGKIDPVYRLFSFISFHPGCQFEWNSHIISRMKFPERTEKPLNVQCTKWQRHRTLSTDTSKNIDFIHCLQLVVFYHCVHVSNAADWEMRMKKMEPIQNTHNSEKYTHFFCNICQHFTVHTMYTSMWQVRQIPLWSHCNIEHDVNCNR